MIKPANSAEIGVMPESQTRKDIQNFAHSTLDAAEVVIDFGDLEPGYPQEKKAFSVAAAFRTMLKYMNVNRENYGESPLDIKVVKQGLHVYLVRK